MQANNYSRIKCKELCEDRGWKKDKHRNVVDINGKKWSFSIYSSNPECRQTYEDTVGFIGYSEVTGKLKCFSVNDFSSFSVSRISPSGLKAHNVVLRDESQMKAI